MERDNEESGDESASLIAMPMSLPIPFPARKPKQHPTDHTAVSFSLNSAAGVWHEEESSGTESRAARHREAAAAARKQRSTQKRTLSVSDEKNLTSSKLAQGGIKMTRLRPGKKRPVRHLGTEFDVVSDGDGEDIPSSKIWACCFAENFDHETMREHCLSLPSIHSVKAVNDEVLVVRCKAWAPEATCCELR